MEIKVYKTAEEVCEQVALILSEMTKYQPAFSDANLTLYDAQRTELHVQPEDPEKNAPCVALSGGSTPKLLFRIMAEKYKDTDWSRLKFFWVDERMVSWEDKESNFGEFYRLLVATGVVPETSLFPIRYGGNESVALAETDATIRAHVPFVNGLPQFDLILLGIGEDGHTASIFPDNLSSFEYADMVEIAVHPQTKQHRITLTGSTLNNARNLIFLCTGAGKKNILNEVIRKNNRSLPATRVLSSKGNLAFYIDEAAAPE